MAQIIRLDDMRVRASEAPPHPLVEALDALGLALVDHRHQWTDRERMLYETAMVYLGVDH